MTLEVNDVRKSYGAHAAVDGVNLQAFPHEILGVVGPNGAGKTTLVGMITGLLRPDSGTIRFAGLSIHDAAAHRVAAAGVARTFQVVKPLRDLTVLENVMVGALFGRRRCHDVAEARRLARVDLERVELSHRAEAECRDISTGETKKMDFARALAMDADLMLLDEPLAGVGVKEADVLIALIVQLAKEGKTIVLVEHVMRAVWKISHRVIVLSAGRKIADGPPEEVSKDDAVIAAYLGRRFGELRHAPIVSSE
jgi:branched-chain amino acid transport system ATP-binding protein